MKRDTYILGILAIALLYCLAYATVALMAGVPLLALGFGAVAVIPTVLIARRLARNGFPRLANILYGELLYRVAFVREPDFIVGADSPGGAYLNRWYLTPWRRLQTRLRDRAQASPTRRNRAAARVIGWLPNLYLHQFLRDDDDRALHDHPSWAGSFILDGSYTEHTIDAGGIHRRRTLDAGSLRFLPTRHTHRIELLPFWLAVGDWRPLPGAGPNARAPCWTLFLFGPTVRNWGFHCPERGWVPWQKFTAAGKPGEVGPGCGA